MKTLNEVAARNPLVHKILADMRIGHTDAATQITYHFKNNYHSTTHPDYDFSTTEASVRRWRRATIDSLDGAESHAEAREPSSEGHPKGSPLNPLEAVSEPPAMKVLVLDIETSPILAYVWGTWKENVNHDMIVEPSEILCFAASWIGSDETMFFSRQNGKRAMLAILWRLLNDADVVVHYNGKKFDIPKINTAFITEDFDPPAPYKQVDLLLTARSTFRFESNKLAYVSKRLSASGKLSSGGFSLWKGCMENNPQAWADMKLYNIQDVQDTKEVYLYMLPWINAHPSFAAHSGKIVCPSCGSPDTKRDGYYHTSVSRYPRYVCKNCGTWSRSTHRIAGAERTGLQI